MNRETISAMSNVTFPKKGVILNHPITYVSLSSPKHERQEEKESGSVEIKLKRYLVIEFRLIRDIGDIFWDHSDRCETASTNQRPSYQPHSKESAINKAGCISS